LIKKDQKIKTLLSFNDFLRQVFTTPRKPFAMLHFAISQPWEPGSLLHACLTASQAGLAIVPCSKTFLENQLKLYKVSPLLENLLFGQHFRAMI